LQVGNRNSINCTSEIKLQDQNFFGGLMPKGQFDAEAFYEALDRKRVSKNLTWKQVAEQSHVSASTLTRMAQGKRPDVDSMAALAAWSGLSIDIFVVQEGKKSPQTDSIGAITTYLRADPNLTQQSADAIEAVLIAVYEKLKKEE
jgi:transcriptional regulator with XRE-family HTH domain